MMKLAAPASRSAACGSCGAFGEPEANRAAAGTAVAEAALAGARLVVLPELTDSGYVFCDSRAHRHH
jgi:5-aminopentanamidase